MISALKVRFPSYQPSIFIALLLFGQVFFSTLADFVGLENRILMLPFRAIMASYSLYIVAKYSDNKKLFFLEGFPLSLSAFWFLYLASLLRDYYVLGVVTALPLWEFFAWGIGGCLLPSLACYLLLCRSGSSEYLRGVLVFGFILLASSLVFFLLSTNFSGQRFQLPSLNPINVSHSFFVLALLSVSYMASRYCSSLVSSCAVVVCAFSVSVGLYAGSRGAFLAFATAFLVLLLASRFSKLWLLIALVFPAFVLIQSNPSDIIGRLVAAGFDLHSTLRLSAIRESFQVFLAHPFSGAGFGYHLDLSSTMGYPEMWYPHNFFVESLALGGIILAAPLFICTFFSIRSCLELLKNPSRLGLWRVAIFVQALGYVSFSGQLANVPFFWIALGLTSSFVPVRFWKG